MKRHLKRTTAASTKKISSTAITGIILLPLLMTGCSGKTPIDKYEKAFIPSCRSYSYGSIEEMTKSGDIVAVIKVTGAESGIHYTNYTAQVKQLICGNDEKEIEIHMTGGVDESEKKIYEIEDDPLMQTGDEFLIFARKNQDGTYTILSGPQGRYEIKGDDVYPLNDGTVTVKSAGEKSTINTDGENLDEFIKSVKSYAV